MDPHISNSIVPRWGYLSLLPELGLVMRRNGFIIPIRLYFILLRFTSIHLRLLAGALKLGLASLDAVVLINVSIDCLTLYVAFLFLLMLSQAFVYLVLDVLALVMGSFLAEGILRNYRGLIYISQQ